ncbi:Hypothetical protein BC93_0516 [Mycoplasmopsis bovis]|nr:Hypothetical protein BC93_0516 [Mycoplasmopsis bovis]
MKRLTKSMIYEIFILILIKKLIMNLIILWSKTIKLLKKQKLIIN